MYGHMGTMAMWSAAMRKSMAVNPAIAAACAEIFHHVLMMHDTTAVHAPATMNIHIQWGE